MSEPQQVSPQGADAGQLAALVMALQQQVQNLQGQVAAQAAAAPQAQQITAGFSSSKTICRPEMFEGRRQGEKLEEWVYKMDLYLHAMHVPDPLRVITAVSFFHGNAMTWWRTLIGTQDPSAISWAAFVQRLRDEFLPVNAVKVAADKLERLKQTGSVANFVREFRTLALQIPDLSTAEKLRRFLAGLKPRVRMEVDLRNPATLDEAVTLAERIDDLTFQASRRADSSRSSRSSFATSFTSQHSAAPMDLSAMRVSSNVQPQRGLAKLTPEEREKLRIEHKCFRCRQVGHIAPMCPLKKRLPSSSGNAGRQ